MQQLGISAHVKRKHKPTTKSDPMGRFAPNLLNREFEVEQPNTRWVTDTKAVATVEGWLYVAAIVDLFSRRVVGWAMDVAKDGVYARCTITCVVEDENIHVVISEQEGTFVPDYQRIRLEFAQSLLNP
ncbi:DUF5110 domain-containing protein [Ktedonobacter robiniae]|uniref:Integrase catalytic domain-containing protein n=1 Tax=Ktedonobacter robiniae TaxID=2778365 RepID=A0ABQ3V144_9CHLR|nr:DUF5110 domain-containing protein [Ktedonobacter robiniae]GHO58672.1 hypothetical protein KSB_71470 [Ktedonobacter robiniae]